MSDSTVERPSIKGLLLLLGFGAFVVVSAPLGLAEGRDQICSAVNLIPGAACGPATAPPEASAFVPVVILSVAVLALAWWHWSIIRQWRAAVRRGQGPARPRSYWPVGIARGAVLLLTLVLFGILTIQFEEPLDGEGIGASQFGLLVGMAVLFGYASASRSWRRVLGREVRRGDERSLTDVVGDGGGWCTFQARVRDGGVEQTIPAPFDGSLCVAWAVGADTFHVGKETRVFQSSGNLGSPGHQGIDRTAPPVGPDDGPPFDGKGYRTVYWYSGAGGGDWNKHSRVEWLSSGVFTQSDNPFAVEAGSNVVTVLPSSLSVTGKHMGRFRLTARAHGDWYERVVAATAWSDSPKEVNAYQHLLRPRDDVEVKAFVFDRDGQWYAGSLDLAADRLPHPIAPDLAAAYLAQMGVVGR